jgi:hypothetical protein
MLERSKGNSENAMLRQVIRLVPSVALTGMTSVFAGCGVVIGWRSRHRAEPQCQVRLSYSRQIGDKARKATPSEWHPTRMRVIIVKRLYFGELPRPRRAGAGQVAAIRTSLRPMPSLVSVQGAAA